MARANESVAEDLFARVMAPLVLGGPMRPGGPIGARAALALLDAQVRPIDADLLSRVSLARVRAARKLTPIDRVPDPTGAEWALGAALHDLLQAASPRWVRRASARRLLDLVALVVGKVPRPTTAHDALLRHTWFARTLEIARNDTHVSWWTGTRDFRGEEPPARLLAWRDVRRVEVQRARHALTELPSQGGFPEQLGAFVETLGELLHATPLTDLATLGRRAPPFAWTAETLSLVRSPVGRALAHRAIARVPVDRADASLGRATRALLAARAWSAATVAMDLLAHRALAGAQAGAEPALTSDDADASFARTAGALVARTWLDGRLAGIADADRRRLAPVLDAASRGRAAAEVAALVAEARGAATSAGSS